MDTEDKEVRFLKEKGDATKGGASAFGTVYNIGVVVDPKDAASDEPTSPGSPKVAQRLPSSPLVRYKKQVRWVQRSLYYFKW